MILGRRTRAERVAQSQAGVEIPHPISMSTRVSGVEMVRDRSRWMRTAALSHLCYPPEHYPAGVGSGSVWRCRCDAQWLAGGVRTVQYPVGVSREDLVAGPEFWSWCEGTGTGSPESYRAQERLYDWRPAEDRLLDLLLRERDGGR